MLFYPKFQNNICKNLLNCEKNIHKIFSKPQVIHKKCHIWPKFASFTQHFYATKSVLPECGLPFSKAYQIMKSCKKLLKNI